MKLTHLIFSLFLMLFVTTACEKNKGELVLKKFFGSTGDKLGEFHFDKGVSNKWVLDHDGTYLFVTDRENRRVQRFDSNHKVKDWWGALNGVWGYHTEDVSADEVFDPTKAVNKNGYLFVSGYIIDDYRYVVFKISNSGNILKTFDILVYGSYSMCIDSKENIFVYGNNEINKYDKEGNHVVTFGGFGEEDGLFQNDGGAAQIVVDNQDNLYIPDPGGDRIQKFDNAGKFLLNWDIYLSSYYASASFFNNQIYSQDDYYLYAFSTEGEEQYKWEKAELHGQLQILVVNDKLYEPYSFGDNIKVYSFEE